MRKDQQISKMLFRVKLPRENCRYTIEYQQAVLNKYTGDKTVYSERPFRIILQNGVKLAAGFSVNEELVTVIIWKKAYGGIRCDGTESYKLPASHAKLLYLTGKIYYDVTNESYAVEDSKIYY